MSLADRYQPKEPTVNPANLPWRQSTVVEIESFRALGVEICINTAAHGEIWIVPDYTEQPRGEITPEHLGIIDSFLDTFPGARVGAFRSKTDLRDEHHAGPREGSKGRRQ